ncbi:MAG: type II toxin-antitoxin system RelE/ParE family toxin [Tannerella sp.]|jgi:plasmid stabilization system protein ParE|nr:type II toxin-antitoxin system RelE/ParE family toxin [Tannerella sp.]
MMKNVHERKNPIDITENDEAKSVWVDVVTFLKTHEVALIDSIRLGENDIKNGKTRPADEVFSDLRKKIVKNVMSEEIKEYSVTVTQTAEDGINDSILHPTEEFTATAWLRLDELQKAINSLKYFPERGSRVPELLDENGKEYRKLIESPLQIIYKIENDEIRIITTRDWQIDM